MTSLRLVALLLGLVVFFPPAAGAQALPVFDQGRTYPREADLQRAIQPYQAAIAADTRNARAHYWLGVAYLYAYRHYPGGPGPLRRRLPAPRAGVAAPGGAAGREVRPRDLGTARRADSVGAGRRGDRAAQETAGDDPASGSDLPTSPGITRCGPAAPGRARGARPALSLRPRGARRPAPPAWRG